MSNIPDQQNERWISRCFDLARRGIGHVSPNPPVGAVLVHRDKILAEGYHHYFGGPHAEVDAISNVPKDKKHLICESILYVSLEPCCISRKTGPCTDLIIEKGIQDVRISTLDPNPDIAGKGVERLKAHGIQVTCGILGEEGRNLIRSFAINILQKRPQVLLKWAQSKYGYSGQEGRQVWFSDPKIKTWSHRQRAEVDAILVGARTVETDDPALTTRNFPGASAQRVIYDPAGRLNADYKVFEQDVKVHYYSTQENANLKGSHIRCILLEENENHLNQILADLFKAQIGRLLVEGGPYLQKQFIKQQLWDEAWVIQTQHPLDEGIRSPNVYGRLLEKKCVVGNTILGIQNDQKS